MVSTTTGTDDSSNLHTEGRTNTHQTGIYFHMEKTKLAFYESNLSAGMSNLVFSSWNFSFSSWNFSLICPPFFHSYDHHLITDPCFLISKDKKQPLKWLCFFLTFLPTLTKKWLEILLPERVNVRCWSIPAIWRKTNPLFEHCFNTLLKNLDQFSKIQDVLQY